MGTLIINTMATTGKKVFPPSWYAAQAARRKNGGASKSSGEGAPKAAKSTVAPKASYAKRTGYQYSIGMSVKGGVSKTKNFKTASGWSTQRKDVDKKVVERYKKIQSAKGNVSRKANTVIKDDGSKYIGVNTTYGKGKNTMVISKAVSPAVWKRYKTLVASKGGDTSKFIDRDRSNR